MTPEKTIDTIKIAQAEVEWNYPMDYIEAFDEAVNALEKQIPKNPIFSGDGYWNGELVYDTWNCPNCDKDYEVDYDKYDYCPNCGQRINWENEV
jgi:hypothetical protein